MVWLPMGQLSTRDQVTYKWTTIGHRRAFNNARNVLKREKNPLNMLGLLFLIYSKKKLFLNTSSIMKKSKAIAIPELSVKHMKPRCNLFGSRNFNLLHFLEIQLLHFILFVQSVSQSVGRFNEGSSY